MKVIDNFIDINDLNKIRDIMLNTTFPWFFGEGKSNKYDGSYQFCHVFVDKGKLISNYFKLNKPVLNKLNVDKIIRIKANFTPKKEKNFQSPMHVDTTILSGEKFKTGVFYLNSNNGSTLFKNGKRIYSKENRMLIFDGHQKHCGVDCTDNDYRIVINYNWTEKK